MTDHERRYGFHDADSCLGEHGPHDPHHETAGWALVWPVVAALIAAIVIYWSTR